MPRSNVEVLEDIVRFTRRICSKLEGVSTEQLALNEDLQDIVIRNFTILGEASTHLSEEFREQHPQIDWRKAISFRNFIVHEYFRTNWGRVLAAASGIAEWLPLFEEMLAAAIEDEE